MNDTDAGADTQIEFGNFRFSRRGGGLLRRGEDGGWVPAGLGSRAKAGLAVLVGRPGGIVTKKEIMGGVWPDTAVEDSNLTVQISVLRRVLDAGRDGDSSIQTEAGRGYRFVQPIADGPATQPQTVAPEPSTPVIPSISRLRRALIVVAICFTTLLLLGAPRYFGTLTEKSGPPRLSLVVLPFQNLSGNATDDYLAESVTDDLTSDLSHLPEAFVIANTSARTYRGRAVEARLVGNELGVRYVVEGSVRRIDDVLRVNVQLISAETGAHVWSDRFDERIADLAGGQDAILARMRGALGISLVEIETARALRAPPTTPDAFDLILKARALGNQPPSEQRAAEVMSLYEQALRLDPSSVVAMTRLARYLIDERADRGSWIRSEEH